MKYRNVSSTLNHEKMKKYDVEWCCVVKNTKTSVIEPASPFSIEGGGGNCVLMCSNKYSHNWKGVKGL